MAEKGDIEFDIRINKDALKRDVDDAGEMMRKGLSPDQAVGAGGHIKEKQQVICRC